MPGAFWMFSLAVYDRPGVKQACLALQAGGLDVNLGLFVIWVLSLRRDPAPVLEAATERSRHWRANVVQPLRAARDALKAPPEFIAPGAAGRLRKQVLTAELQAERLQQDALEPLAAACVGLDHPDLRAAARAALRACGGPGLDRAAADDFVETIFDALEIV